MCRGSDQRLAITRARRRLRTSRDDCTNGYSECPAYVIVLVTTRREGFDERYLDQRSVLGVHTGSSSEDTTSNFAGLPELSSRADHREFLAVKANSVTKVA